MYAFQSKPFSLSLGPTLLPPGVVCCSYLIYSGRYGHPSEWGQFVPVPATFQNGNDEVLADDNDDTQSNFLETKAETWDICMEGADLVAEMVLSSLSPLWDASSKKASYFTFLASPIVLAGLLMYLLHGLKGDGRFSSSSWSGCGKSIASTICEIFCTSHVP